MNTPPSRDASASASGIAVGVVDRPATLPFPISSAADLPMPEFWFTTPTLTQGEWTTAIARKNPDGTGYCGRCPKELCTQHRDFCQVVVRGFVSREEAASFVLVDGLAGGADGGRDAELGPARQSR